MRWCDLADASNARQANGCGAIIGTAGVGYVRTLLGALVNDASTTRAGVQTFEHGWERMQHTAAIDLWSGAGGIVCAARDLLLRLPGLANEERQRLTRIGAAAYDRLLEVLASPLRTRERLPLGLAHGCAGELFAALSWDPRAPVLQARLAELSSYTSEEGGMLLCPKSAEGPLLHDLSGSLCDGMTGHALLWIAACRVFG